MVWPVPVGTVPLVYNLTILLYGMTNDTSHAYSQNFYDGRI